MVGILFGLFSICSALVAEPYVFQFGKIETNPFSKEPDLIYSIEFSNGSGADLGALGAVRQDALDPILEFLSVASLQELSGRTFSSELRSLELAFDRFRLEAKSKGLYVPPSPERFFTYLAHSLAIAASSKKCPLVFDEVDGMARYEALRSAYTLDRTLRPEWQADFETKLRDASNGKFAIRAAKEIEEVGQPGDNFVITENGTPVLGFLLAPVSNGFQCRVF
jgi:hypothetical protein